MNEDKKKIETLLKIEDVLKESGLDYEFLSLPPDEQTQENPHWTYVIEFNN